MPQDPAPQDHPAENSKPAAPGRVDIEKILLPQKEVRKVESAQRINAGVLFEQEKNAALPETPKPEPVPAPKPKDDVLVKPLETYQSDIEGLVQDKNVSVIAIAAAEAKARAQSARAAPGEVVKESLAEKFQRLWKKTAMVIGGIVLIAAAVGAGAYVYLRLTATEPVPVAAPAPFIAVDGTQVVTLEANESSADALKALDAARQSTALSLGLIERLVPAVASTTPSGQGLAALDAPTFLSLIAPHIPQDLLLTLEPNYLLGVHVYDGNQAFLILTADSYEQAYSGLLQWEPEMESDLTPLFAYAPPPQIPEQQSATTATTTPSADQFLQTGFVDAIVENHDARVLQNQNGQIYLLWTFLDRNTIVITTNDATLREIISRVQQAPQTPQP